MKKEIVKTKKPMASKMNSNLFHSIASLIQESRKRVAVTVNSEIALLYWHIGKTIRKEVLKEKRAEYGKQIVEELSAKLTESFGKGWSAKQLRHCLRFAETIEDEKIVSALRRQLTWTHIKTLIYIEDDLKRDFYLEICKLENWSSRQSYGTASGKISSGCKTCP